MQDTETAEVLDEEQALYSTSAPSRVGMVRSLQLQRGDEPCFMTDKRLLCKDNGCEWRRECRRLVAVWKR